MQMKTISKLLLIFSVVEILVYSTISIATVFADTAKEQTGAVLMIGLVTVVGTWAVSVMCYGYEDKP